VRPKPRLRGMTPDTSTHDVAERCIAQLGVAGAPFRTPGYFLMDTDAVTTPCPFEPLTWLVYLSPSRTHASGGVPP